MVPFKILVFILSFIVLAQGACRITVPDGDDNIPRFEISFGTKKIRHPYAIREISWRDNDNVLCYCATGFNPEYRNNRNYQYYDSNNDFNRYNRYLALQCQDNRIRERNEEYNNMILSCNKLNWTMHEPEFPFSWCESNMESIIISTENLEKNFKVAALCYDLEKISLRSVHFAWGPDTNITDINDVHFSESTTLNETSLGVEIHNPPGFLNQVEYKSGDISSPYFNLKYSYGSIIQDDQFDRIMEPMSSFFNIIWWENLRIFNWNYFMTALRNRTEEIAYNVYLGTSGTLQIPRRPFLPSFPEPIVHINGLKGPTPAYIWSYLETVDGHEDFVVIGYNSPYYEFFDEKDTIFCKDMCDQIPWLEEVHSTFRYTALGVIFCCNADEVRQLDILDGFPKTPINQLSSQTKTTMTTTTAKTTITPSIDQEFENEITEKYY